jgi:receptor protein-tyrosine kinase
MSLIEKAAKRLAELQRAGVKLPGDEGAGAPAAEPPRAAAERVPIPEAAVRKSGASDLRSPPAELKARADSDVTAPPIGEPGAEQAHPIRRIDLDLARLEREGVLNPEKPESALAQEFRAIKRPIIRNATGRSGLKVANGNLVMVTSAMPKEGKTYVATNLAISIAMEVDHKVLLVDGDFANPTLSRVLRMPSSPGLLDLLIRDDLQITDALLQTNIEGLTVLPSGQRDRRATELIASERMGRLLHEITQRYPERIIIFDSPPLLPTSEAPVLAAQMGQVIMTVAADSTTAHAVRQALALLDRCDVVMMLLNRAGKTDLGSYHGYYGSDSAP